MIKRYNIPVIEAIWSDESKFNNWLKIELLVCEAWNQEGVIPENDIIELKKQATFKLKDILEIEKETKHDVVAFTRAISKATKTPAKKWIHYGLTSTDIVDTANAMAFKQVNNIIRDDIVNLMLTLKTLAMKYKNTYQIGRTHGIHAEITTFGLKLTLWYNELERQLKRFNDACEDVETIKISGAVGTFANTGCFIQDYVAKKLNLNSAAISTQVWQRDNHANYFNVIALIGASLEHFATEIRHLMRTEVNEVQEGFSKNQKGSSAMPHKKNPIGCENICGMSRLLQGYSTTINMNINLWHERDISHSSNERIVFLDGTITIVYMLRRFNNIMSNLIVNETKMNDNIKITNGLIFSQTVLLYLINTKGLEREKAYDLIQAVAMKTWNSKQPFESNIKDSKIMDYISKDELDKLFDYKYHCRYVDDIYERVFNGKTSL